MTAISTPYEWISHLPRSLVELDSVPLFGHTPPFPWDKFEQALGRIFQVQGLTLRPSTPRWRTQTELLQGMVEPCVPLHVQVPPLEGSVCWLLSESDVATLMVWLLERKSEVPPMLQDGSLQEAFYHFLAMECCAALAEVPFDQGLTAKVAKDHPMPSGSALCVDVTIGFSGKEIIGRLAILPSFYKAWRQHYSSPRMDVALPSSLAQKLEVSLHLHAGKVVLNREEWAQVVPGNVVLLDSCSIRPAEKKGRVFLTLNGKPLFRARFKPGAVKILEFPVQYEAEASMDTLSDDIKDEESGGEEDSAQPGEFDIPEFTEEASVEENVFTEEHSIEESVAPVAKSMPAAASGRKVDVSTFPITMHVELGQIQLPIQKVMELQPGNLLELDVRPEDGVNLVVNGKCIGKGELVQLGDVLGVRILDLA